MLNVILPLTFVFLNLLLDVAVPFPHTQTKSPWPFTSDVTHSKLAVQSDLQCLGVFTFSIVLLSVKWMSNSAQFTGNTVISSANSLMVTSLLFSSSSVFPSGCRSMQCRRGSPARHSEGTWNPRHDVTTPSLNFYHCLVLFIVVIWKNSHLHFYCVAFSFISCYARIITLNVQW